MSEVMSEGPEVIWAWPKKDWYDAGASTEKVVCAGSKDIEYIRADIHRDKIKELGDLIHKRGNEIAHLRLQIKTLKEERQKHGV